MSLKIHCAYHELVAIKDLKPNPANENLHTKKQISALKKWIKKRGQTRAITVSKRSGFMVTGHGFLMAVKTFLNDSDVVAVDYQDFSNDLIEFEQRNADNELGRLSEFNKNQFEINARDLGIDLESYELETLGLIDFASVEQLADELLGQEFHLEDEQALQDKVAKEHAPSAVDTGVKKEKEQEPEVKELSADEALKESVFMPFPASVLDARAVYWQTRKRQIVTAHNKSLGFDPVLIESLAKNFAPGLMTVFASHCLTSHEKECLTSLGVCLSDDDKIINECALVICFIDERCTFENAAIKLLSKIVPGGRIVLIFNSPDELENVPSLGGFNLTNDTYGYVSTDIESAYIAPVLTFQKEGDALQIEPELRDLKELGRQLFSGVLDV